MENSGFADIIFFAAVAGFILFRLYTTLGRKDGGEGGVDGFGKMMGSQDAASDTEKVAAFPGKSKQSEQPKAAMPKAEPEPEISDEKTAKILAKIKKTDKQFSAGQFLAGSRMAFEMVLKAFAEGDKKTLKQLLSSDVYKAFSSEIDKSSADGNKQETTLVSIVSSDIAKASLKGNTARIEVDFTSQQVHLVRDAENRIVEGDPSHIDEMEDRWAFERNITSANPNWMIVAT